MNLKIDFTRQEKRRLWKAGMSLKKLEDYTLNDLLKVLKADKLRTKEISKQFYNAVTDVDGAEEMGYLFGMDKIANHLSRQYAWTESLGDKVARISRVPDLVSRLHHTSSFDLITRVSNMEEHPMLKRNGGIMESLGTAAFLPDRNKFSSLSALIETSGALSNKLGSALTRSNINTMLDALKPLGGGAEHLIGGADILSLLRRAHSVDNWTSRLSSATGIIPQFSSATSFNQVFSASTLFTGESKRPFLAESLLAQAGFQKLGIGSIANHLQSVSAFERSHHTLLGPAFSEASRLSVLTQRNLGSFKWAELGSSLGAPAGLLNDAKNEFLTLSKGYSETVKSISSKPNWVYDAPELAKLPTVDYYVSTRILKIITEEEVETGDTQSTDREIASEGKDDIQRYLPMVDEGLPRMWLGALAALNGDNPDRIRHFITSLRELFTHLIQILAPNKEMKQWDKEQIYLHNGSPTREGRFKYISRYLEGSKKEVAQLLESEIATTLKLISLYQGGTHGIRPGFSDIELQMIRIKSECVLRLFLNIEFKINRHG